VTPWPVLLFVRELDIGGIERDVVKLACNLDRKLFEPHVGCFIASGLRYRELRDAGIPILELPIRSFRSLSTFRAAATFREYIRRHGIRLVHSYDPPTMIFAVPLARLCRIPFVISSQLGHRDFYNHRWLLRTTDHMVDRIHVNCEAMRRHMIDDESVHPDRLYLCYNGVDTTVFFPAQHSKPAALAGADLVIGIVCALRPEKRVDLLLEAFTRVRHLRPRLKVLILGSGPLLGQLQTKASGLGISDDCVFEPATSDVSGWMRAIDIFVLPSDSEAFSNALLESMASGCCPIGSRVGGTPELIEDGRHGFLFERGDVEDLARKLAVAITDDTCRRTMAQAAATFAREHFSVQRNAATMGALYASLLRTY
jgi:glycosyltransferase involved in cell wall biosynthesis